MRAVTSSRISPIMITSGDCRSTPRSKSPKPSSTAALVCDWRIPSIAYSMGSSIVLIFRRPSLSLISVAYNVAVLPLPVGPVMRISPPGLAIICW